MEAIIKRRLFIYTLAAWVILGCLVIWAAYFSLGNEKIAFSQSDGGVYEIPYYIVHNMSIEKEQQWTAFPVDLEDNCNYRYFCASAKGINNTDVVITIVGATTTDKYNEVFRIEKELYDGNNIICIPSDRFTLFTIIIDGTTQKILQSAEFRESLFKSITRKKALQLIVIGIVYLAIAIVVESIILRKARRGRIRRK